MEEGHVGTSSKIGATWRRAARRAVVAAMLVVSVPLVPATPAAAIEIGATAATASPCPTTTPCLQVSAFVGEGSAVFPRVHVPTTSSVTQQFIYRVQPLDGTNGTVARMFTATPSQMSFAPEVVEVVTLLTHPDDQDYDSYLAAIAAHPIAKRVKIADMLTNLRILASMVEFLGLVLD